MKNKIDEKEKLHTLSEFRREAGIPLVLAKKMIIWGEVKAIKLVDGTWRITGAEVLRIKDLLRHPWKKTHLFLRALGPGVITGASDDDPSGIGTYSSVGAKFGLAIIWTAAWLLPMMLAIQEVCARIGIVTNKGLAGVLQKHYRKKIVFGIVILLIIANVANIGADIGAMAASVQMLTGFNYYLMAIFFAVLIILLEIFIRYHVYVRFLKWLTLSVFAYVVTAIIIKPDWLQVLKVAFVPHFQFSGDFVFALIAIFGTSITPYLFFWQASEEVEENKQLGKKIRDGKIDEPEKILSGGNHELIRRMRTDVYSGMILANLVFFFIVLTTAQVLFKNGVMDIGSADQAALALRPLAGDYAYLLFAIGIIGTGLLAVPILAGSGAYAICELFKWRESLELKFSRARGFYLIISASILVGLGLNFIGINPIKALYYAAYLNGIIALPLLVAIMVVGNDKKIMGEETHPRWVKVFGWAAVGFMAAAVATTILLFLTRA